MRFGLVLCTKYESVFPNKSTALKAAGALLRDGETPKWHVQVNKQEKRRCPGLVMQAVVGRLPGCRASCAWLGWETAEELPLKCSAYDLFPPPFLFPSFLFVLPLFFAARKFSLQKGHKS